jgi:hypothetical protein
MCWNVVVGDGDEIFEVEEIEGGWCGSRPEAVRGEGEDEDADDVTCCEPEGEGEKKPCSFPHAS